MSNKNCLRKFRSPTQKGEIEMLAQKNCREKYLFYQQNIWVKVSLGKKHFCIKEGFWGKYLCQNFLGEKL